MRILEEVKKIARSFSRADSIIRGAIVGAAWGARLPEVQAAACGELKALQVSQCSKTCGQTSRGHCLPGVRGAAWLSTVTRLRLVCGDGLCTTAAPGNLRWYSSTISQLTARLHDRRCSKSIQTWRRRA